MVNDDSPDCGSPPSFWGLDGEKRFHAEVRKIAAQAGTTDRWLEGLLPLLRQLVNYDAAWLGRFDAGSGRYLALLEDGDVEPLRQLFASDVAAADIERLGFRRAGWPMLGHRILPLLTQSPGWNQYLAPAGFADGVGVGLQTADGRHVGYLTLLTYRPGVVPATAAALLNGANPVIADGIERAYPQRAAT